MGQVKQIIKNGTYYFFNVIINIEEFDSNLLKIDKRSYKDIDFPILDILQFKKLVIMKIFTV